MAVIVIVRPGDASLINGIQSACSNLLLHGFHPFNYNSFNLTRDFLNTGPYAGYPALMVLLTVAFCITKILSWVLLEKKIEKIGTSQGFTLREALTINPDYIKGKEV